MSALSFKRGVDPLTCIFCHLHTMDTQIHLRRITCKLLGSQYVRQYLFSFTFSSRGKRQVVKLSPDTHSHCQVPLTIQPPWDLFGTMLKSTCELTLNTLALTLALMLERNALVSIASFAPSISIGLYTRVKIEMDSALIQRRQRWRSVWTRFKVDTSFSMSIIFYYSLGGRLRNHYGKQSYLQISSTALPQYRSLK